MCRLSFDGDSPGSATQSVTEITHTASPVIFPYSTYALHFGLTFGRTTVFPMRCPPKNAHYESEKSQIQSHRDPSDTEVLLSLQLRTNSPKAAGRVSRSGIQAMTLHHTHLPANGTVCVRTVNHTSKVRQ